MRLVTLHSVGPKKQSPTCVMRLVSAQHSFRVGIVLSFSEFCKSYLHEERVTVKFCVKLRKKSHILYTKQLKKLMERTL